MNANLLERITMDPRVMVGKPVIRGTRIPVELVVRMVAQGMAEPDIIAEHPRLTHEDIQAAMTYAAQVLANEDVFPVSTTA